MFVSLVVIFGLYLYEWISNHSTKYIQSIEERCKNLEIQVTQLEEETRIKDEKITSLLNHNQRLELSISGNDMELYQAFKRQDEEILTLKSTIETLRKINHEEEFERNWERHFANRSY